MVKNEGAVFNKQDAERIKGTKVDTSDEEKQLAILNRELQQEKERKIDATPEQLVKSGKYKINDKSGELYNNTNQVKNELIKFGLHINREYTRKD